MKLRPVLNILGNKVMHAAVLLLLAPCAVAASNFHNIYSFTGGNDGWSPQAGLVGDGSGNFYGTTAGGGTDRCGTIFELSHANGGWSETVLYNFPCGGDGMYPADSLIFDQAGNLYGTISGNFGNYGNVFELVHHSDGSWSFEVLYNFTGGDDGANPMAGLVFDAAGNLYGTTSVSNQRRGGSLFQLIPSGGAWKIKVLHRFAGGSDGESPMAAITYDSAGNLYGTTEYGGGLPPCGGCGTVFQLTPQQNGNWKYQVIPRFRGTDGNAPFAGVILDAQGNLYGTTSQGGPKGSGTVFELTKGQNGHWEIKSLHNFGLNPLNGDAPLTAVLLDTSGNLWGTTFDGGNLGCVDGCGVVFELTPNAQGHWNESVVHTFADNPGYHPAGTLISDTTGHLYGTTEGDGTLTFGSVYEITP
jgi:uncharacterized repeat protein (TIGR03803 family)